MPIFAPTILAEAEFSSHHTDFNLCNTPVIDTPLVLPTGPKMSDQIAGIPTKTMLIVLT